MEKKCIVCGKTHNEIPLTNWSYRNSEFFICPQHLPTLIHKPTELASLIPGADEFPEG